jgi:hypothetical protein
MNYTIYKKLNGEIFSQFGGSLESLQLNIDFDTQDYIEGNYLREFYYIQNNEPVEISRPPDVWYDFNYNTKQWVANRDKAIDFISEKRKKLLIDSDWTQLPNGPLTQQQQEAWAVYRQQLRDIPQQSGYPFNVVWPTPP